MFDVILKYAELITAVLGVITIIVKLTPTLKDDNILLPIIKFLGNLVNRQTDDTAVRKTL